jgi:hypothetical protein
MTRLNNRPQPATPLALHVDTVKDRKLAVILVMLLSLATISVVASTNTVSRQHAQQISAERTQ